VCALVTTDTSTRRYLADILCALLILVVCVGAVGLHVREYKPFGPIDEVAHIDYVHRVQDGELPRYGQKLIQRTRDEVECRGVETLVAFADHPDCDRVLSERKLPEGAEAYEAGQPPLYYAVTAVLANASPVGDDVDAARAVGGLWLGVGAIGVFLALRRLDVGRALGTSVSLVLALAPGMFVSASTVANDISVFTWAGIALWFVIGLMRTDELRWPQVLTAALIGLLGGMTKPTALLVAAALALAIGLAQWKRDRLKAGLVLGGAMVAGIVVSTAVWGLVVNSIQHTALENVEPWVRIKADTFGFADLFKRPLFLMFTPNADAWVPQHWRQDWIFVDLRQVAFFVQIGLLLLPLLARWPRDPSRSIGIAYLVLLVISGPYYSFFYYAVTHVIYGAATRFAFGFAPMLAVILATWPPKQWQRWTATAVLALPALWYLVLVADLVGPSRG
jgi:hypothetical protein